MKGEVQKGGQAVVIASHIWKRTMGGVGHGGGDKQGGMRTQLLVVQLQVHPVVDLVVFQRNVVLQVPGIAGGILELVVWPCGQQEVWLSITIDQHLWTRTRGYKVTH